MPIYDDLNHKLSNLEGYTFTAQSRMDLLLNLQLLIEQGRIKIPNDEILINELKSFEYLLWSLREGFSDLRVQATLNGLRPGTSQVLNIKFLPLACSSDRSNPIEGRKTVREKLLLWKAKVRRTC